VLNKAGIVLAIATSGTLVLSPLAFAGGWDDDGGHHHGHHFHGDRDGDREVHVQEGLINLQDNDIQVPIQACNNSVVEGVLGILALGQSNRDSHDGECRQSNLNR
jgi:hypothetical protein